MIAEQVLYSTIIVAGIAFGLWLGYKGITVEGLYRDAKRLFGIK